MAFLAPLLKDWRDVFGERHLALGLRLRRGHAGRQERDGHDEERTTSITSHRSLTS
jgi:hypothetical protein